ncbi:unnamed protein product [Boreogadus saida]
MWISCLRCEPSLITPSPCSVRLPLITSPRPRPPGPPVQRPLPVDGAVDRSSPVGPELSGARLRSSAENLGISTILNPTWREEYRTLDSHEDHRKQQIFVS